MEEIVKKPILEIRGVRYLDTPITFGGGKKTENAETVEVDFHIQTVSSNFINGHWRLALPESCTGRREELRTLMLRKLQTEMQTRNAETFKVAEVRYLSEPSPLTPSGVDYAEVTFNVQTDDSCYMTGAWRVDLPKGMQGNLEEIKTLVTTGIKEEIL